MEPHQQVNCVQYHLLNYDPDAQESDSDDDTFVANRKTKVRVKTA